MLQPPLNPFESAITHLWLILTHNHLFKTWLHLTLFTSSSRSNSDTHCSSRPWTYFTQLSLTCDSRMTHYPLFITRLHLTLFTSSSRSNSDTHCSSRAFLCIQRSSNRLRLSDNPSSTFSIPEQDFAHAFLSAGGASFTTSPLRWFKRSWPWFIVCIEEARIPGFFVCEE